MKAKQKSTPASRKRPAVHTAKPVRAATAEKAAPAAAAARDTAGVRPRLAHPKSAAAPARHAGAKDAHAHKEGPTHAAAEKRPLGIERRAPVMPEDRQSQLKLLIARGKEQGYLTYAQVNDHLPSEIVDPEQIEDIVNTINDMGIPVYEKAPDTESLLASEPSAPADEEAIEEAAAALAALDAELGRTTDPVRMYMREMGTV